MREKNDMLLKFKPHKNSVKFHGMNCKWVFDGNAKCKPCNFLSKHAHLKEKQFFVVHISRFHLMQSVKVKARKYVKVIGSTHSNHCCVALTRGGAV